jgi:4-oxalomesaconate tautomerase
LAAVSVATAALLPGSIAEGIAQLPQPEHDLYSIEHPSGECSVTLDFGFVDEKMEVTKAGVLRTARLLSRGEVFVKE